MIENAAREPEIIDVVTLLNNNMGAHILSRNILLFIDGVPQLYGTRHQVHSDRIEAGTYIALQLLLGRYSDQ